MNKETEYYKELFDLISHLMMNMKDIELRSDRIEKDVEFLKHIKQDKEGIPIDFHGGCLCGHREWCETCDPLKKLNIKIR